MNVPIYIYIYIYIYISPLDETGYINIHIHIQHVYTFTYAYNLCSVMSDSATPWTAEAVLCSPLSHGQRLLGSSVHGISQARTLEWVAIIYKTYTQT